MQTALAVFRRKCKPLSTLLRSKQGKRTAGMAAGLATRPLRALDVHLSVASGFHVAKRLPQEVVRSNSSRTELTMKVFPKDVDTSSAMTFFNYHSLSTPLLVAAVVGGVGGLSWFVCGVRMGRIRNNRYRVKGAMEVLGGAFVAPWVAILFLSDGQMKPVFLMSAFASGVCWASLLQVIRKKFTRIVEAVLGENLETPGQ